jgi:hypothetical protein
MGSRFEFEDGAGRGVAGRERYDIRRGGLVLGCVIVLAIHRGVRLFCSVLLATLLGKVFSVAEMGTGSTV